MSNANDRSWMYRMRDDQGYLCNYYCAKIIEFLDFAFSHEEIVEAKRLPNGGEVKVMRCPCKKCKNGRFEDRETITYHLMKKGFMPNYTTWDRHGEMKSQQYEGECSYQMDNDWDANDGYAQMVMDNMHHPCGGVPSMYPNNLEVQDPNPDAQQFYAMLQDADTPLWNGCQDWSKLQAATRLLSLKSECNMSEVTYNKVVTVVRSMLPNDNKLPASFYETKKTLKNIMLKKIKIHACKNHCMLFYNEHDELSACLWCNESRYKSNGRTPNLVLTYLPITPRLQKLYMAKRTAKEMTWHADNQRKPGIMVHPSDGEAWKHFDATHLDFSHEIRNVRLGLCTDGFNPNSSNSNPHSTWPVFLTIYNLPPWMSLKSCYVNLTLLIPGKKSPGQNLDVFLRPLIDELRYLYDHGVETFDAYRRQNFKMRAVLLWTVSDFPAYAMLSGWSTHGKLACPYCMGCSGSFQLQNGGKSCWFDCHRMFLDRRHPFRKDKKWFTKNKTVNHDPPPELTGHDILEQVRGLPTVYDGTPYRRTNRKIPGFGQTHNWVKRSIFWELPYWPELLIRHNLDVMHIEKNVFENLFHTVMDTSKTKDNVKARKDVEKLCDRPELHMFTARNNKMMKPKALYSLSKPQVAHVCQWLKKDVRFPDGYASNINSCVNVEESTFYGFKSHDCHVFMQRLLPIALKGMIPNHIWDAITELCNFFRIICQRELHLEDLTRLQKSIVVTICKLEKIFPPAFFDSMEHLVVHLTREAILGGPVQYRWMYLFERKLGSLKRTIRNKARIEGSIVEAYLVDELSTHCSLYYEASVETRHNREPRNFAPDVGEDSRLGIFKVPGRSLSNKVGKRGTLTDEEMTKIRLYILLNCAEVQPLVQQFEGIILARQPDLNQMQIDIYKENHFVDWFTHTVRYDQAPNCGQLKSLAQRPLRFYRQHEGYFVNGYKFHTITRGQGHVTMNSGVWVKGSLNQNESDYYGELENIYEIKFVGEEYENTVVLFKCRWFDPVTGVKVDKHDLVEVKKKAYGCLHDPYVLASQCFQVFYVPYPSTSRNLKDFCAVVKTKPRAVFEVSQSSQTVGADDDATFFQEHDRVISRPSELTSDHCLADRGIAQEVNVENVNIEDCSGDDEESENESEEEEEFEDDADESSEEELNLSDDSSD